MWHGHHFFTRAADDELLAFLTPHPIVILKITLLLVDGENALQSIVRSERAESSVKFLIILLLARIRAIIEILCRAAGPLTDFDTSNG